MSRANVIDVPIGVLKDPVTLEEIEAILAAAEATPSAANLQPWMFLMVSDLKSREVIARHALDALGRRMPNHRNAALAEAPSMVLACMDVLRAKCRFGDQGSRLFGIQDVAVAIDRVRAKAAEVGFASTWVREIDFEAVGEELALAPRFAPQALLVFGKADMDAIEKPPFLPPRDFIRSDIS